MIRLMLFSTLAYSVVISLTGCAGGGGGGGKAVETVQSSGETITLATPTGELTDNKTDLTVTFTDPNGQPVDVQSPSVRFFMPPMGAMGAMQAEVPLEASGKPGVFKGTVDLEMKGTWQTTIAYQEDGKPQRAVFNIQAL